MTPPRVAVIDTTFARIDMGTIMTQRMQRTARGRGPRGGTRHRSRVLDLTAAARRAIDDGAHMAVACGMPGPEPIDGSCARDASFGLQMVQALTGSPVLEVFVHMSEALDDTGDVDEARLAEICRRRCGGHAENAVRMVLDPAAMISRAGTGHRQGADDAGTISAPL